MTYKIISAIIRDNLRFDTLPIIKANVLYYIKSLVVYQSIVIRNFPDFRCFSILKVNWFLLILSIGLYS